MLHRRQHPKLHRNYTNNSSASYNAAHLKMSLTCNIDARGKRARMITGILLLAFAAIAGAWAWHNSSRIAAAMSVLLALSGAFTVFESRAGWCALRAMGIKTRL
jgi:hypothetical protein